MLRNYVHEKFKRSLYFKTYLSEVAGMVLVEVDSVMVLSTSVTTTSRVLSVLADTAVTVRDVATELPGLLLVGTHV
jgi:hypothetical protein